MSTEIVPFQFEGIEVRTVTVDGEPWFIVADAARILGYRDAANAARLLRPQHKGYSEVSTPSGTQRMFITSESGLYRLVLRSNADNAESVQDWVTDEVLPAIRHTGSYSVAAVAPPAELSRIEILTMALDSERRAITAECQVVELAPKAEAWDEFISSDGLILIGTAAKQAGYGQNKAYQLLRGGKILRPDNIPYSSFERYFELTFHPYEDSTGRERIASTTKLTPASLPWFKSTLDRLSLKAATA